MLKYDKSPTYLTPDPSNPVDPFPVLWLMGKTSLVDLLLVLVK